MDSPKCDALSKMPRKDSTRLRHGRQSGVRWPGGRHWPCHMWAPFGTDRGTEVWRDTLRRRWSLSKGVTARRCTDTLRHPCLVLTAGHTGGSSIFPWSYDRLYGSRESSHLLLSSDDIRNWAGAQRSSTTSYSTIKTVDIFGTCSCDKQCLMT